MNFGAERRVDEVHVIGVQENYASPSEPTEAMTSRFAPTDFQVQYWTGSQWANVSGGGVTGNNKVWRKFTFPEVTTTKVRVWVTRVAGDNHSQLVELEAWGTAGASADLRWLVTDHLGTPRMVLDRTGTLAGVTRHDYLPFGEELKGDSAFRTAARGYAADGVRQRFTGYERDGEISLDYARARYYSGTQGRFTSPDPFLGSGRAARPQSWNRYSYVVNNPLKYVDPDGADLVLAEGLSEKQRKFIVQNIARLYMTPKGRRQLERADRSPFTVTVGRGKLEKKELNPAKPGEYKFGGTEHVVGGNTKYDTVTDKQTGDKYLAATGPPGTESLNPIRVLVDKDNASDMNKDPATVLAHEIGGHVNNVLDRAESPDPNNPEFKITGLDPNKDEKTSKEAEDVGDIPDKASPQAVKAAEEILQPRKKKDE